MVRPLHVILAAAALLLAGCPSLPDTKPFADATTSLRGAVVSSGTAVVSELKRNPIEGMAAQGTALEREWKTRAKLMSALGDYAQSITAIADAGNKGGESAQKLADAANTLAQTLGAANLAASAGATLAIDTFKFVNGQIARARAAKSLDAALTEMQPAIERIAELLAADLGALDEAMQIAIVAQQDKLARDNQAELNYRKRLVAARQNLMGRAANELTEQTPPTKITVADELKRIDELLAYAEQWRAAYDTQQAAIAERGRLGGEMIATTRDALGEWAVAHAKLLAAVRTKRAPNVSDLVDAAKRIQDLVARYRQL